MVAGLVGVPASAGAFTYPCHRYDEASGLPASTVHGVAQDQQGALWFATRTGLARYDGRDWTVHGMADGLPATACRDVAVGSDGRVWALAGMAPPQLAVLEAGGWRTIAGPSWLAPSHGAVTMAVGATEDGGTLVAVVCEGGVVVVRDGDRWHPALMPDAPLPVTHVAWQGRTLVLSTARGLLLADWQGARTEVRAVAGLPDGAVYATVPGALTAPDRPDHLTVLGEGWVAELAADGEPMVTAMPGLELSLGRKQVAAARDHLAGIYVASLRQIWYLGRGGGLEAMGPQNGLIAPGAADILCDREGLVWFAGMRGVTKLISRALRGLDAGAGLLEDEVSAVLELRDGTMLLGHETGVTLLTDPPRAVPLPAPPDRVQRVMDLLQTRDGAIWIAYSGGGLLRADDAPALAAGRWREVGTDLGLEGGPIALLEDASGRLWVGGNEGLFRVESGMLRRIPLAGPATGLDDEPAIRHLHAGTGGAVLVTTTRDGLLRWQDGTVQRWSGDAARNLQSTYAALVRPDGEVWVGTAGGLARVGPHGLELANRPRLARSVFALTPDHQGGVWLGTDAGAYHWNGERLRHIGRAGGLLGSETNRAALVVDTLDRIWIGTNAGVNVFDADLEVPTPADPLTWIAAVEADGRPLDPAAAAALPADTAELVFHFGAAAFRDEARVRFRTFLEGFDPGWREPELLPGRRIRYTALPPGTYRFHVQAIGPDGGAGSVARWSTVRIQPPLWRRPWFLAIAALGAAGLVWLGATALHDRRYARRLAREIAARTAELADSERAQRQESARLAAVLQSISDGVVAMDAGQRILLANPAAGTMLGHPVEALVGRRVAEVLPELASAVASALRGSQACQGSVLLRPEGHEDLRELEFVVAASAGGARSGAPDTAVVDIADGAVLALRDVTERRRAEAEHVRAQKLESLGVLAGGIAHDFNNLLTAILGHASLIEQDAHPGEPAAQSAAAIRRASERAQGLTVQLLTFARGGAPQKELTDLAALLRETAELALSGTSVTARFALAADLHPVEVDRAQIAQVISNLLINARQAMPDGGTVEIEAANATLEPRADASGEPTPGVQVIVRDHGPGIPADRADRIFEPYFTTKDAGTGLGLAVSYSVVARHGGWLGLRDAGAPGATFAIELPARPGAVPGRAADTDPQPPGDPGAPVRILVLDDQDEVRRLIARMLERAGYAVTGVATGEEAVATYRDALAGSGERFAAVILDLTVPGALGGVEALQRIRELDPGVRAIVASGYSHDPIMSDHVAHGFAARLAKPFDRESLLRVVAGVVTGHGAA